MVAYSFKRQFAAPIVAGTKAQTIRADRKRHAHAGEALQLYTGMRTLQCKLVGRAICQGVIPIKIDLTENCIDLGGNILGGWGALDPFARSDGFDGWLSMTCFWRENHPDTPVFSGVLILWKDFIAATPQNKIAQDLTPGRFSP